MSDLRPLELPGDGDWKGWLEDRGRGGLKAAAAQVAALKETGDGDGAILQLWNDAGISLANTFAVSSLLSSVHPEPAVVELAEDIEAAARAFSNDLHLDADVHAKLRTVRAEGLDACARRVLDETLRDFRRGGVDLDARAAVRLRDLNERETRLGQAFSRNIRDGRRTAQVPESALAGLPADWIEAHPTHDGQVTVGTEYPAALPFLTFCADADARRAVATEFFNIAWPQNDEVLADLLKVRDEKARLLGYADWPSYDAEVKMIGRGDAIPEFIEQVTRDSAARASHDLGVLLERARRDGVDRIDASNWRYYFELVKREKYGVDAQDVRRFFSFERVHDGLLEVTGKLFGLRYEEVDDAGTWHDEVSSYDVFLDLPWARDELLGRIHLDLHPRDRKYNHAAQFDLVPGVRDRQLPEGVLVCNFPRGLMNHSDVVTLFHEFGHLMHHVLAGRHEWVRFSGVATEWDFVEAPSQMLEEWAWDASVLRTFASADGEKIPVALVERMREAEEFGKGLLARTQMFYAALSYRFHHERPRDLTRRMLELYDEYSLVRPLEGTHFHCGFGHLEGYTSGYYTYMWSKVIAKDLFSAFSPEDLFDTSVAHRYRDLVLVPGGSRDAADLVSEFLGRPYDTRAFTAWLNS